MATFTTGGIAAEMAKFDRFTASTEKSIEKAVKVGGKLLAEKLKEAAPVGDTKQLRDSLKAGSVKYDTADGYHVEVGSGKAKRSDTGESLAKIGNILEYGRSNMPARPWFNPTIAANESAVINAMESTFNAAQGNG